MAGFRGVTAAGDHGDQESDEAAPPPLGHQTMAERDHRASIVEFLAALGPRRMDVTVRPELEQDEAAWFLRAVESEIVRFRPCAPACPRLRDWGATGSDEFLTPSGAFRHLFSFPPDRPRLNREYIPHIAAYAKAILGHGYDPARSSFSRYRSFARDAITRRAGTSFETDAEFYAADGSIWLQLEAKRDGRQIDAIAAQIDRAGELDRLPLTVAKEIEYVLELRPAHLWLVGPGSIDPARHVFAVAVDGLTASFTRVPDLPSLS